MPSATAEHPIEGVITLLDKLELEARKEGEEEAATFQKFTYWCKRSTRRLTRAIKKEKKSIEMLEYKIEGLAADIETTEEDIAATQAQLEKLDQEAQRARAMRGDAYALWE